MAFLQLTAIGNVGREPEMSYTPNGIAVTKFSLAINTKQGDKEVTTWLNCVACEDSRKRSASIYTRARKSSSRAICSYARTLPGTASRAQAWMLPLKNSTSWAPRARTLAALPEKMIPRAI